MRRTLLVVGTVLAGACAHAAPSATREARPSYALEVRNATGVDLALGFCGARDCEELGSLPAGQTRQFSIEAADGPGITLFGKEGDRWIARTRVELLDGEATRVSLTPITR